MASNIDLHIHTTASDGSWTPEELAHQVRQAGLKIFAVTDHDTVSGALEMERYVPEGTHFLRGIEFSCTSPAGKCHILGYGFDPSHPDFQSALEEGRSLRLEKMKLRVRQLQQDHGIVLTPREEQWLWSQSSPGKPHLGRIILNRGLAANLDRAIQDFIRDVPGRDRIEAETALKAIEAAGGISIWAHPLGGEGEKRLSREKFEARLAYLTALGLKGMECWYSRYSMEEVAFLLEKAAQQGLFVSGGSDCHGENKEDLQLGRLNIPDIPAEGIDPLAWGPDRWYNL